MLWVVIVIGVLWNAGCSPPETAPPPPLPAPSTATAFEPRALPAPYPDARLLRAAQQRMGTDVRELHCGPYAVWTDVADAQILAVCQRIAGGLEAVYRQRYGLEPVGRAREGLFLFADLSAFRRFATDDAGAGLGHGGFALPSRGLVALYADGISRETFAANLAHELTHLLERRSLGVNLPPWLSEGLADGISDTASSRGFASPRGGEGVEHLVRRLREAYRQGRVRGFRRLTELRRGEFDPPPIAGSREVAFDYEQSALFVRFLLDDPSRAAAFRGYLRRVAAGEPPTPQLLVESLGASWSGLEASFRDWLERL